MLRSKALPSSFIPAWPSRPVHPARLISVKIAAGKGLTPYQGSRRCFGYYRCPACSKQWKSAYSWADCYQECNACYTRVYPHKMRKLEQREEEDEEQRPPHHQELCEKCKKLGYNCSAKAKRQRWPISME